MGRKPKTEMVQKLREGLCHLLLLSHQHSAGGSAGHLLCFMEQESWDQLCGVYFMVAGAATSGKEVLFWPMVEVTVHHGGEVKAAGM